MNFKLKVQPETFSTPSRSTFSIGIVEAFPVGTGITSEDGVESLMFYISYKDENGLEHSNSNVPIPSIVTLPDNTVYPLLSNLFSSDPLLKYEAMTVVASIYNYVPLPIEEQ